MQRPAGSSGRWTSSSGPPALVPPTARCALKGPPELAPLPAASAATLPDCGDGPQREGEQVACVPHQPGWRHGRRAQREGAPPAALRPVPARRPAAAVFRRLLSVCVGGARCVLMPSDWGGGAWRNRTGTFSGGASWTRLWASSVRARPTTHASQSSAGRKKPQG